LSKPFDLNILLARLSGLLRRVHWAAKTEPATAAEAPTTASEEPQQQQPAFTLGDRTIDLDALEIRGPTETIHLTVMEADLLRYLLSVPARSLRARSCWRTSGASM